MILVMVQKVFTINCVVFDYDSLLFLLAMIEKRFNYDICDNQHRKCNSYLKCLKYLNMN